MEYKDLEKANAEISFIDVKGKNYADVANRVNAFQIVSEWRHYNRNYFK